MIRKVFFGLICYRFLFYKKRYWGVRFAWNAWNFSDTSGDSGSQESCFALTANEAK